MRSLKNFPQDTGEVLKQIEASFLDLFVAKAYVRVDSEPIIPRQDRSVLFTSATITTLKPRIQDRFIEFPGVCLVQPCLRVQNSEHLGEDGYDPAYMSYFRMAGLMAHPMGYKALCKDVETFFRGLEIDRDDILIRTSGLCEPFFSVGAESFGDMAVELDTRSSRYYHWRYGMGDIVGTGYTFAIRDGEDSFGDVGNIVEVRDQEGVIGYEFGFGTETLAARLFRLRSPFESALISTVIPFSPERGHKMLQDCIVVATVLYRAGVRPGTGGAPHILKRLMKGLDYLLTLHGRSEDWLVDAVQKFEQVEFGFQSGVADEVCSAVRYYRSLAAQNLQRFEDFVRNQRSLVDAGALTDSEHLRQTIRQKGQIVYHLAAPKVEQIVHSHFSD